jgi:predicted Zn-dependent protease
MQRRTWLVLAIILAAVPWTAGCQTNSLTGKRNFMLITEAEDISLGQQAAPGVASEMGGTYGDPTIRSYVQRVGGKVAAEAVKCGSYAYPFTFDVLDADMANAFALPGGSIFVTRGLLFQMQNEAELAGVLAHEVTHVSARHSAQQISKQVGAEIVLSVLKGAGSSQSGGGATGSGDTVGSVAKVVGGIISLKYSRDNEYEADSFGTQFAIQAGYSPGGLVRVMEMFMAEEKASGGSTPAFLRTHPYPDDRIKSIHTLLNEKYPTALSDPKLTLGREAYQQNVLSRAGMVKQYSKAK